MELSTKTESMDDGPDFLLMDAEARVLKPPTTNEVLEVVQYFCLRGVTHCCASARYTMTGAGEAYTASAGAMYSTTSASVDGGHDRERIGLPVAVAGGPAEAEDAGVKYSGTHACGLTLFVPAQCLTP